MIKHAPKKIKPCLEHLTKNLGKKKGHNQDTCKDCQKANKYLLSLVKNNKCANCGKKLKQVKGDPYTFECPCMPGIFLSSG